MPAITPDHTPINAESFQEVEIISNHYREIETKSLDHFKDEFRKNENSLDKVSTVALIAFLKKSGNVYQDWRILKKNLTDKYTELQSSRNSEYELIYRKLVTNDKIKPTALIGDIFQSVVEDVLNVLYIWTDSEKKEQSKLIESIRDQSSKDKDENLKKLYRDMIQKKLKERDRSFILFQDLLKESAFNWNQAYRKKFHQSLAATVKKLESSKASKAEILNNKKAAKKAILGFYEEDKIQKYSIFMVDYFLDRLLEKESIVENKILLPKEPEVVPSKEKENMDSIQKKSEIQTSLSRVVIEPELKNEKPNPTKKECPITDLPDHLIKECYSDYLIVDLSTKEKRLELHRIRLGKENQNTRAEAIEFFSHCANKDISAVMLAESALRRHNITQEEEEKLNEMIRKQNACK
ncbi:hypothetical protein RBB68_14415 [Leptospira interrogans]|uniref:Uncharacterized protein n=14 Tax=Leptospira interrogans TaxID=173 RepID=Q8F824_LEPIN|nr:MULTISPECIES: hypothetical protein [Leptospira]APH42656.1 Uncharacterized protein A9P81_3104 [Leptospira interrogans serovar Copenhageni/Icterohaemorrhagiae]EMF72970.1 hypothetical protein LEP1GSC148_2202 [Leptospira interrogans serovar Canicola str. LT1962]EMG08863.1 hypothetical protein LEP1GSC151_1912 [Leptospira interrogans serovar Grippotyphosa str. LT2186]EMN71261.1 hypothetical protein LEP1GSC100_1102 [Leptospira interrogans serovar Bataviae str. UI 08561]EMY04749.1 hypothetical prot